MTAHIRLGTSSFTAAGWSGTFYPIRMKQADYLSFYSTRFDTVEVDSTFYAIRSYQFDSLSVIGVRSISQYGNR